MNTNEDEDKFWKLFWNDPFWDEWLESRNKRVITNLLQKFNLKEK